MADPSAFSVQLLALNSAISNWQIALFNLLHGGAGGPGQIHPDGGIGGPAHNGYRLIVAPASRRASGLGHGLNGLPDSLTAISDPASPDPQSGWDNSNQLLSQHFATDDGVTCGPLAVLYCRSLGPDWYLPSKDELQAIISRAVSLDSADTSGGALSFAAMADGDIWSSTRHSQHSSWVVRASDGQLASRNRSSAHYIVPVRRLPL